MLKLFLRLACFITLSTIFCPVFANQKCPNIQEAVGQCISVGTYQLFMKIRGNTGPIVVFEGGRGNTHDTWDQVVPTISQFSRTVTYDRANLGYSQNLPDTNQPFAAKKIAEDLHAMLHAAKLTPPYILVAHSNGGLYVQMFARLYPKEVSGVVFVDAASADQLFSGPLPSKTDPAYPEALGFWLSQQQLKKASHFPHVPIVLLTASYHGSTDPHAIFQMVSAENKPLKISEAQDQALWENYQNHLAQLSPDSIHLYAYNSDHYIQNFQPNLVVDAVYTLTKRPKLS